LILGCDSVLALAGEIYGKPATPGEAIARWQTMRGQIGELYTGHVLIAPQGLTLSRCAVTRVHFAEVDDSTIQAYVDSGEPMACAGAFAIDGKGGVLVEKIEGCHTNVIGLSLPVLRSMLEDLGYRISDFW
jgi:septum formation protein